MRALRGLFAGLAFVTAQLTHADEYPQALVQEQLEQAARPIEADPSALRVGEMLAVQYVGRPVLVYRRTKADRAYLKKPADPLLADASGENLQASIHAAYASSASLVWARLLLVDQPGLEKVPGRSQGDEYLVIGGWNPASGCRIELIPTEKRQKAPAVFADACTKVHFDAAGRLL